MRLIDADALSESIQNGAGTELQKFFADVCVATAPTIDAVPVVRCKDCVCGIEDGWICGGPDLVPSHPTYPDAFCSYGERRRDD